MAQSQDCHPLTFAVFYALITSPWVQPTLRRRGPYRTCGMPTTYFNIYSIFSITKIVFSNITCLIWRFSKSVCELPSLASHSPPVSCLHGRNIQGIRLSRKPPHPNPCRVTLEGRGSCGKTGATRHFQKPEESKEGSNPALHLRKRLRWSLTRAHSQCFYFPFSLLFFFSFSLLFILTSPTRLGQKWPHLLSPGSTHLFLPSSQHSKHTGLFSGLGPDSPPPHCLCLCSFLSSLPILPPNLTCLTPTEPSASAGPTSSQRPCLSLQTRPLPLPGDF